MKTFLTLLLSLTVTTTAAMANMPPTYLDLGNDSMSERKILSLYSTLPEFDTVKLYRVEFGKASTLCISLGKKYKIPASAWASLPNYGCTLFPALGQQGKTIVVYSFDTPKLARVQKRNYDPRMSNHVLRHEFAHAFFDWPANHPDDCDASCQPEDQ